MKRIISIVFSFVSFSLFAIGAVDVSQEQMLAGQKSGWLVIDVRSLEEYNDGHVPGAINIPHGEIGDRIEEILEHKDRPVVVYCRSGFRAGKAAQSLLQNDFTQVKHLDGDMNGWVAAERAVEQ